MTVWEGTADRAGGRVAFGGRELPLTSAVELTISLHHLLRLTTAQADADPFKPSRASEKSWGRRENRVADDERWVNAQGLGAVASLGPGVGGVALDPSDAEAGVVEDSVGLQRWNGET